jgi:hypothetical protein
MALDHQEEIGGQASKFDACFSRCCCRAASSCGGFGDQDRGGDEAPDSLIFFPPLLRALLVGPRKSPISAGGRTIGYRKMWLSSPVWMVSKAAQGICCFN